MDHEIVLTLKVYENGLAVQLLNLGLDPVDFCEVILERLDRFVEHRRDFTRGGFKRFRVLSCPVPEAGVSVGGSVFAYHAQDKTEVRGLTEGTWRAEFSIEIDGQQTSKEVRFIRWKPGSAIELVDDPRRLERDAAKNAIGDHPGNAISPLPVKSEPAQLEATGHQTGGSATRAAGGAIKKDIAADGRQHTISPIEGREQRVQDFIKAHPGTSLADVKHSADVFTADFQRWRQGKLRPDSVMAGRIEDVLNGTRSLKKRPRKQRKD